MPIILIAEKHSYGMEENEHCQGFRI